MTTKRKLDEHMPAVKLMRKWGSNKAFSDALEKPPTTTDRWLNNGHVSAGDIPLIHDAARRDGIKLAPDDFVDLRLFGRAK